MRERRREKEEENPGKCRKMDEKVDDCEGKKSWIIIIIIIIIIDFSFFKYLFIIIV